MSLDNLLLETSDKNVILMGNEAIARGFIEGGIQFCSSYPGTPSSEIMAALIKASESRELYVEWSTNEKVAAEVAISASISGLRSMVSMKGVGVNVASEPFQAFTYMKTIGGIVLVSADDVGCHSSHTEQDNRFFAREAYIPVLEPCNPQEAKDMAKMALELSETWGQPIMLRITTRIAHTSSDVTLGKFSTLKRKGEFLKLPDRWVNLPKNARRMRKELILRMETIKEAVEDLTFNRIEGNIEGENTIIASGIVYGYVKEAIELLGISNDITLLKIGTPYPIPEKLTIKAIRGKEKVLVMEELEPFVESQVARIANRSGINVPVMGKEIVPLDGELSISQVTEIIAKYFDYPNKLNFFESSNLKKEVEKLVPPRPPVLCPGCNHRAVFYAIRVAERRYLRKNKGTIGFVKPSDIGCYTLGFQSPLEAVDTNFCMGSSIGISSGLSKVIDDPIVCTIGDGTFFHAGIPPLLNTVFNKANVTVIILDNSTTAMTGFQPHPGMGMNARGETFEMVSIPEMVSACKVDYEKRVDATDINALVTAIEEAVLVKGPAVIIAQGPCRMLAIKELRGKDEMPVVRIDHDKCKDCRICIDRFGCPGMYITDDKVAIDATICNGCGICTQKDVCPPGAIIFSKEEK